MLCPSGSPSQSTQPLTAAMLRGVASACEQTAAAPIPTQHIPSQTAEHNSAGTARERIYTVIPTCNVGMCADLSQILAPQMSRMLDCSAAVGSHYGVSIDDRHHLTPSLNTRRQLLRSYVNMNDHHDTEHTTLFCCSVYSSEFSNFGIERNVPQAPVPTRNQPTRWRRNNNAHDPVGYQHGFVAYTTASNQLKPLPHQPTSHPHCQPTACSSL